MKRSIILILMLLSTSCSHIRMKYAADIKDKNEEVDTRSVEYVYYRSYEVGFSQRLFCGLTAIFYGGLCWSYLLLPTEEMKEDLRLAAEDDLNHKIGKQHVVVPKEISSHSYNDDKDVTYFTVDGEETQLLDGITPSRSIANITH